MIEFDVDMNCLLECGELDKVILNDECGEHEPMEFVPEDAATVGYEHKDNPRNYKPNGEPKIPNMSVGADPDWVDWVASLEHKKPSGITEAVQQLMFEAICFGGEMGPNDCGGENCPDEGMVYTEGFIRDWVEKISAMMGRSCAACPEMDNPDSYIFHLMRVLEQERGTCRNVAEPPSDGGFWPAPHFECSKCGHKHVSMSYVYFCPSCGAKVVDE